MNIYLVLIILMLLYGTKYNKKNNNYLDKSNCSCIKGVFLLFVFYRHIKGYVVNPIENNLYINSLDNFLGQLIVTPFLFYSGFGVMESIKKNKKKYIEKIPAKRCLLTWFNFAIAVLIFLIVDIFMGIEYSKKSIVLSFLAWDTIGNSNWYIFGIIALYLITYLSFSILDKDYKKAIVMNIILSFILILGISYFKENWWYDTLLTYPLGMYYSFYVKDINRLLNDRKKYYLILICLIASFTVIFINLSLNKYMYELLSCAFVLIIVIFTFKLELNNKFTKWIGDNIFGFYIMMRIPMIIFSKTAIVNNVIIFLVVTFVLTIIITYIFMITIRVIDNYFEKRVLK